MRAGQRGRTGQQGFTLIELVVVIVILGILAATAIPKFVDMQVEAANASAKGVAAAIGSWTAMNYAKFVAAGNTGTAVTAGTTCATLKTAGLGGSAASDTNITVGGGPLVCGSAGATDSTCTVTHSTTGATAQTISAICTN